MVDQGTFENLVWVSVAGGIFGVIGLTVRAILKSNCKEFSCCFGMIRCMRHDALPLSTSSSSTSLTPHASDIQPPGMFIV